MPTIPETAAEDDESPEERRKRLAARDAIADEVARDLGWEATEPGWLTPVSGSVYAPMGVKEGSVPKLLTRRMFWDVLSDLAPEKVDELLDPRFAEYMLADDWIEHQARVGCTLDDFVSSLNLFVEHQFDPNRLERWRQTILEPLLMDWPHTRVLSWCQRNGLHADDVPVPGIYADAMFTLIRGIGVDPDDPTIPHYVRPPGVRVYSVHDHALVMHRQWAKQPVSVALSVSREPGESHEAFESRFLQAEQDMRAAARAQLAEQVDPFHLEERYYFECFVLGYIGDKDGTKTASEIAKRYLRHSPTQNKPIHKGTVARNIRVVRERLGLPKNKPGRQPRPPSDEEEEDN